jgi:hypothetical protein
LLGALLGVLLVAFLGALLVAVDVVKHLVAPIF